MQAVVKVAPGVGNVELRDVPEPTVEPGQAIIAVEYTGICGTDLHIYLDEYRSVPPVTLGHEIVGRVAAVGAGVTTVREGDRVVPETYYSTCGRCRGCLSGRPNLCPERRSIGTHVNGGMARLVAVPAARLHAVPAAVETRAAALTEPLTCCVHALVDLAAIHPGDVVLVSGPGPIGLLCLQVARAAGARTVLCGVDGDEVRLAAGQAVGAERAVNASREPLTEILAEMTGGAGPDVCIETAGAPASFRQCLDLVRRGGTIVQIGLYARPFEADINAIAMKEVRVIGSFAHVPSAWDRALALIGSGAVQTAPLISDVVPLEAWHDKFESLRAKRDCKVLLAPGG